MSGRQHLVSKSTSYETTACGLPSYRRSRVVEVRQATCDACLLAVAQDRRADIRKYEGQ